MCEPRQSLPHITNDHNGGMLTFSIDVGRSSAWAMKPGRSRSDLNPIWTVRETAPGRAATKTDWDS